MFATPNGLTNMKYHPLLLAALLICPAALALGLNDIEAVPHLDASGQQAYRSFLNGGKHRAFAIAPGGAWSWSADAASAENAADNTVQNCEIDNGQRCLLYALDDRVVFDAKAWAGMWGPYADRASARNARKGLNRGDRFHNLAFRDPSGKQMRLSDLQGKVVVLHFWGSWCPPCRREMPDLQRLQQALGKSGDIRLVLLQVREDAATARNWASRQHLKLPLYDSGASAGADSLPLADGGALHDRYIAEVFPTTYILDKHGIVVYSHIGPMSRWPEYLPLLRDVAARSGK
jgi:thiol-disulfide isomerase/thioredoxin